MYLMEDSPILMQLTLEIKTVYSQDKITSNTH